MLSKNFVFISHEVNVSRILFTLLNSHVIKQSMRITRIEKYSKFTYMLSFLFNSSDFSWLNDSFSFLNVYWPLKNWLYQKSLFYIPNVFPRHSRPEKIEQKTGAPLHANFSPLVLFEQMLDRRKAKPFE